MSRSLIMFIPLRFTATACSSALLLSWIVCIFSGEATSIFACNLDFSTEMLTVDFIEAFVWVDNQLVPCFWI